MSDALSNLQKFAGTCTPAAFGAEPPSWEHPHAADKTTAIATHNSTQRLTGLSERDTAGGMVQSLQHPEASIRVTNGAPGSINESLARSSDYSAISSG